MFHRILVLITLIFSLPVTAEPTAPWGSAKVLDTQYAKQKVVYDTSVGSVAELTSVLR